MAKKKYQTIKKKTIYKFTPKNAAEILKQETTDYKGNLHTFILKCTPHKPSEATIRGFVNYGEEN